MKKSLIAAAIAAASLAPAAALAQDATATAAAAPTVGAKVYDAEGGDVGTVEAVTGDVITVNTGTVRAGLPKNAFAMREKGLTIGMNKAQLEAAVSGAKADNSAAKEAAMVVDAPIKSNDGTVLGTISKIEGDNIDVQLSNGSAAQLKKSYLGLGADGGLVINMSAAQFAQATQAAGASQASADAGAAATATGEAAATTGDAAPATGE